MIGYSRGKMVFKWHENDEDNLMQGLHFRNRCVRTSNAGTGKLGIFETSLMYLFEDKYSLPLSLQVGEFIHTLGDAHIYLNHIEPLKVQVSICLWYICNRGSYPTQSIVKFGTVCCQHLYICQSFNVFSPFYYMIECYAILPTWTRLQIKYSRILIWIPD